MVRKRTDGPQVTYFQVGGEEFAVLAVPAAPALPSSLSAAERAVVKLVIAGRSNAEIARARRVSVRTVANQVASILRKLGVGSRASLIAALARSPT